MFEDEIEIIKSIAFFALDLNLDLLKKPGKKTALLLLEPARSRLPRLQGRLRRRRLGLWSVLCADPRRRRRRRRGRRKAAKKERRKQRLDLLSTFSSLLSSSSSSPFRFTHWNSIDAFIYFSHELVTVPPPAWTDAAHDAGVLSLGTFIFEHESGLREAEKAFGSSEAAEATAGKLAGLASWFGFDGWLFNVEVAFKRGEGREGENGEGEEGEREGKESERERTRALIDNCLLCLRRTRELLRSSSSPHSSLVLWYDAVTSDDGSLSWQNALNSRNLEFFDACDGIFTNYCWKTSATLRASVELATKKSSRHAAEVWAGADAFGRGSFGGAGSAGVAAAAAAAAAAGASLAVFAPGSVPRGLRMRRK